MTEFENNNQEIVKESAKEVADRYIDKWLYSWEAEKNSSNQSSLGRVVLDCLEAERPKRNELEMLELIHMLRESMNEKIKELSPQIEEQIKNAIAHLSEAYNEFKSIKKI